MKTIDCRNMACPAPVITVKKALEDRCELLVLLDDGAPRENVTRFARNRGCQVIEQHHESGWALSITPPAETPQGNNPAIDGETVMLIGSDRIGDGPEELGRLLMRNFIHTLLETREMPSRILFVNSGIFLTTEGSEVVEALSKLAAMGVEIASCGLCLDFFNRRELLRAGVTTNMLTIAEALLTATRVIRL